MQNNPLTLLPAKWRKVVYGVYGGTALAAVGVTAYYAALPDLAMPDPVVGGLAVIASLAGPFSVLAASNVREDPPE